MINKKEISISIDDKVFKFEYYNFDDNMPRKGNIGIYAIYCEGNNKILVGQTRHAKGFNGRWSNYRTMLKANKYTNKYLQSSFNKYGKESFKFLVIERCDKEQLFSAEINWIQILNSKIEKNGFNITNGGESPIMAESTKQKNKGS